MNKCDICGIKSAKVKPGRWIFYCPAHRSEDVRITQDNELPSLSGAGVSDDDAAHALQDGELMEMLLQM